MGFGDSASANSARAPATKSKAGAAPEVFFKMFIVGFFERIGLDSRIFEANASHNKHVRREDGMTYQDYIATLAEEARHGFQPIDRLLDRICSATRPIIDQKYSLLPRAIQSWPLRPVLISPGGERRGEEIPRVGCPWLGGE